MNNQEYQEDISEIFDELSSGRYKTALIQCQNILNNSSENPEAMICMAWALLENGESAEALEYANLSVKLSGESPFTHLLRGYILYRLSIYEGAIADFNFAISNNVRQINFAYLNKARALAGLENFIDANAELAKVDADVKNIKQEKETVKKYLDIALGTSNNFMNTLMGKKEALIDSALQSFEAKEYWFTLWAIDNVLKNSKSILEKQKAQFLEINTLFAMFRYKSALNKAELIKDSFKDNKDFLDIYNKVAKHLKPIKEETDLPKNQSYNSSFYIYDNDYFNILQVKTYDLLDNIKTSMRNYLSTFNYKKVKYIGVEVVMENPVFQIKNGEFDAKAVWYSNGIEIGIHKFKLNINKNWRIVEFVQSWGNKEEGFWSKGQGRVDIYLNNIIVCTRWFIIGNEDVINKEKPLDSSEDTQTQMQETQQPDENTASINQAREVSLQDAFNELENLVGLEKVKNSIRDLMDYINFLNERKKLGIKTQENISFHSIFLGAPGTGKTTVARLLGSLLKAMGIVSSGHVVEVDRTSLIGQYIGETAQKTDEIIKQAFGGILFIDEAYTLKKEGTNQDFGQEAIDIVLKRMEDLKSDLVVIAAGYPNEMKSFIDSNPGLKSRFSHFFDFEDFTPDQLVEIFERIASKEEYKIDEEAKELLKRKLIDLYRRRDASFGNARIVKRIFNESALQLSKRYLQMPAAERTKDALITINSADIAAVLGVSNNAEYNLGINTEALNEALNKLNGFIGLSAVKNEINQIVKLAHYYIEQGENPQNKFSSHLIFSGSPGTGKTTVARLFSEIYSALGILPKGHLVEADRQALVGSYIGQTAEKTSKLIDKAIGGTLFIDEAYTLSRNDKASNDFGQEAIDTLLKRMEDDRGKFVVIVAGYTEEMKRFIESNPGLQSRFSRHIYFEDYSPDELFQIAEKLIKEKGYALKTDCLEPLKNYLTYLYNKRTKAFGNGRLVRTIVEDALKNHLLRIAELSAEERSEETSKFLDKSDFKVFNDSSQVLSNNSNLDNLLKELHSLAGLLKVKEDLLRMFKSLKVANLRRERGLSVIKKNLNSIYIGGTGTGKKSVARLSAKILKELSVLTCSSVTTLDHSSFISAFPEQTSQRLDETLKSADGGLLYLSDVFSLSMVSQDVGYDVVEMLLRKIEKLNLNVMLVAATNKTDFKKILKVYPKITAVFPNQFIFEDYSPRELLEVALSLTSKLGYKLDEGAWQLLLEMLTQIHKNNKSLRNAKLVEEILYKAIANQEERLLNLEMPDNEQLSTIIYEDIYKIKIPEYL